MLLLRDVWNPQSLDAGALLGRALKSETYLSWPLYSFKLKCCRAHGGWWRLRSHTEVCITSTRGGVQSGMSPLKAQLPDAWLLVDVALTQSILNYYSYWEIQCGAIKGKRGTFIKVINFRCMESWWRILNMHGHPSMKWAASFNYLLQL